KQRASLRVVPRAALFAASVAVVLWATQHAGIYDIGASHREAAIGLSLWNSEKSEQARIFRKKVRTRADPDCRI
ncbi:MAG: hypothetical protein ACM3NN_12250, partial [Nitrospirota bacterium]